MKQLFFDSYEDCVYLITGIFDYVKKLKYGNDVAIVAKYDEAIRVIEELVFRGYKLKSIEIQEPDYEGYTDEYIISIANIEDDDDGEIWCEPMLQEDGYLEDESTVIYIFDTCSSKVIPYCKGALVCEVSVDEDDYDDDEGLLDELEEDSCEPKCSFCCGCCGCEEDDDCDDDDCDDDCNGFTVSKTDENGNYQYFSFYTTNDLSVDDMQKIAKKMGF